jgi:hypothetical protein
MSEFFPILVPILIWLTLMSFFLAICVAIQDGVTRLKRLHQVPCSRCAFYTGSYHLKCPVHPYKALSEDAINCLDYELSKKVRSPSEKRFRKDLKKT